jgi:hypothetical protein
MFPGLVQSRILMTIYDSKNVLWNNGLLLHVPRVFQSRILMINNNLKNYVTKNVHMTNTFHKNPLS